MHIDRYSRRKITIGDLRHYIDVYQREAIPNGQDIDVGTTPVLRIKAAVDFPRGVADTGKSNIENADTAVFYVRNTKSVNMGDMIVYENITYAVKRVAPTDGYKWFLKITCTERGAENNTVNLL